MGTNKISFFKKYFLSIVEQRMFPYVLKEGVLSAIGFFAKTILLFSTIFAIAATAKLFDLMPEYIETIDENVPNFVLEEGIIKAEENAKFRFDSNTYVCIVGSGDEDINLDTVYEETNKKYSVYVLVKGDGIDVYTPTISDISLERLGKFVFSKVNKITKAELITELNEMADSYMFRLLVMLTFILVFFVLYGIYRAFFLVLYAFSTFVLNIVFINRLRTRDYFKIAVYVSSLPIILEAFAFLVAKHIPETASFISMLISLVYIFYALRAIKVEKILQTATGKTTEEKIKNAIIHAQEELEKQIEDLEKKQEELDEKKKEREEREESEVKDKEAKDIEEKQEDNSKNDESGSEENSEDKK